MLTYALLHNPLRGHGSHRWLAIATSLMLWMGAPQAIAADLTLLTEAAIASQLTRLPGWATEGMSLHCTYRFNTFVDAVAFVNRVVAPAETAGHHPDLILRYNIVTVRLTTHDAGGLTQQDFDLAQVIAQVSGEPGGEPRLCLGQGEGGGEPGRP